MATKDPKSKTPSPEDDILRELEEFDKKQDLARPEGMSIFVRVSDDKMKAFVNIEPPMDHENELTPKDVKAALAKAGVVFGINDEAVEDIFHFGSYNVEVPVAAGSLPEAGKPSKIEFKFETDPHNADVAHEVDERGNVDLRELNRILSVEPGTLLAVKIDGVPGKPGKSVLGVETPMPVLKDVKLPAGENTEISEDGLSLIAKTSGQPILRDGKVCVSAVYRVNGDVNYGTGNIDFKGSVSVSGNVMGGFVVKATDDIDISGNIEKARIEAGGDIRIHGGLYGQDEGRIVAGGSISIRSIESGYLEAGKDIHLGQSARYSTILAGGDITLTNSRGSIVGGKVTAGHIIDVSNLGSPSFTETLIEVGMNPRLREAYNKIEQEINEHKAHRDKVAQTVKTLQAMRQQAPLPEDKEEMLKKLVNAFHQFNSQIEQKSGKMTLLLERMKALTGGKLRVSGKAYPGVKIKTIDAQFQVRKEINHSSFYEQNEQIIVGPY